MSNDTRVPSRVFRPAQQEAESANTASGTPQTEHPAYRLAFQDMDFLLREDLRPVRFQLELLKPQLIPLDEAGKRHFVVCSGGGPSIMEAANRGAQDVGAESIGLNIVLPHEQAPNPYVSPGLSLQFHYFALRKMHFLLHARAVAVFPGGFGTFDESFELLTLIQTGKIDPIPVLFYGKEFWQRVVNFQALCEEGVIGPRDLSLFHFVETAQEGWDIVQDFWRNKESEG
jgi:uncharacterized protein (TIGR00730 family)